MIRRVWIHADPDPELLKRLTSPRHNLKKSIQWMKTHLLHRQVGFFMAPKFRKMFLGDHPSARSISDFDFPELDGPTENNLRNQAFSLASLASRSSEE